jgi:lambda family phage tail tape measure protein
MTNETSSLVLAVDSRQVNSASAALDRFASAGKGAERSTSALEGASRNLGRVVSAAVFVQAARAVIGMADNYKNLQARLELVTRGSRELAQAQLALFQVSQQTRVGVEQTTDLFTRLSRATASLGVSQEEVVGVTKSINQALIVSGTNAQSASAALVQLGQGFASGVLRGEELNSVLEQAPRLAQAIADGLGVTVGQLRKLGAEGELTGQKVFRALQKSGEALEQEFTRMPLTVGQAFTQVGNAALGLIETVDKLTGTTSTIATWASDASKEIEKFGDGLKRNGGFFEAFMNGFKIRMQTGLARINDKDLKDTTDQYIKLVELQRELKDKGQDLNPFQKLNLKELGERLTSLRANAIELSNSLRGLADAKVASTAGGGRGEVNPAFVVPKVEADELRVSRLKSNVSAIESELNKLTAAYSGAEHILEATRNAGLTDEQTYYEAKRGFIRLNEEAEIRALQAKNRAIAAEKIEGKDAQERAQKQVDTQAELAANIARIAIIRNKAAAEGRVLSTDETAALARLATGYALARQSAEQYLDTLKRQGEREAEAAGLSDLAREKLSRRGQTEDKFQSQRDQLAGDLRRGQVTADQYAEQLALIEEFYAKALETDSAYFQKRAVHEADWSNGAARAFQNYVDSASNASKAAEDAFASTFKSMEDALVQFATTGKADFKSLANSIIANIIRVQTQAALASVAKNNSGAILSFFSNVFGDGGRAGGDAKLLQDLGIGTRASGGPVSAGGLYQVNERGPELLNVGNKSFLMMGSQGGSVTPNGGAGGVAPVTHIHNYHVAAGVTRGEVVSAMQQLQKQNEASVDQKMRNWRG